MVDKKRAKLLPISAALALAQLSQLGIEMYSFDSARAVSFHHKPYYPTDGYTLLVVVALAILP